MAGGGKNQRDLGLSCHPHAMRIFGWDVDHVAGGDCNVPPVDVDEAPARDDVEFVVAFVGMQGKARAWLHPHEVTADRAAVRLDVADALFAVDAAKRDAGVVVHGTPVAVGDVADMVAVTPGPRLQVHACPPVV